MDGILSVHICVCTLCILPVLKNELQKVAQYRKTFKKSHAASLPPKFSKDLKVRLNAYLFVH